MKVTCIVQNKERDPIEGASVKLLISRTVSNELQYDPEKKTYVADIDVHPGRMASIEITFEGYEPANFKQRIDEEPIVVTLGEVGAKYVRDGNHKLPLREYVDLIGISSISEEGKQVVKNLNLEQVTEYKGKKLTSDKFFRLRPDVLEGKTEKQKQKLHKDTLKALKKAKGITDSGIVHDLEFGGNIYANMISVTPLRKSKIGDIRKLIQKLGLNISAILERQLLLQTKDDCGYDLFYLMEKLYESELFEAVYPEIVIKVRNDVVNPPGILWPGQFDHKVINVKGAWQALEANDPGLTYGRGDIIVGVKDSGISQALGMIPAFTGTVQTNIDGTPATVDKLYKLYDFYNHADNNDQDEHGNENKSDHGTNVSGIISARITGTDPLITNGILGIAPDTRLLSIISQNTLSYFVDAVRWMAGLKEYTADGSVGKLENGIDVYTTSQSLTHSATAFDTAIKSLISDLLLRGRKGRGLLMVGSAGNESSHIEYGLGGQYRFSTYENVLSIGAISYFPDYTGLRKSVYSNTGKIDFCAPSSNGSSGLDSYDPPRNFSTWTPARVGTGVMPDTITSSNTKDAQHGLKEPYPLIEEATLSNVFPRATACPVTDVNEEVTPGETNITVASVTGFAAGVTARIYDKSNKKEEVFRISSVGVSTISVDANTPINDTYTNGNSVIYGGTFIPETKLAANAASGAGSITVNSVNGFVDGMFVLIWDKTNSISEGFKITVPVGNTLTLDGSTISHSFLSTDVVEVYGLTTIQVTDASFYSINQRVVLEHTQLGRTYFENMTVWRFDIGLNELYMKGAEYNHQIDVGIDVKIRDYHYIEAGISSTIPGPLPAGYNPTGNSTSGTINSSDYELPLNNASDFVVGTLIRVESGGNVEWKRIDSITLNSGGPSGTLDLDSAYPFSYTHNSPTIEGYPAVKMNSPKLTLYPQDHLKITHATEGTIYVEIIELEVNSDYWALRPNFQAIIDENWEAAIRVPGLRLNNITGLADGDKLLLGDPEFAPVAHTENSETIEVEKVVNGETIILKSIRKGHLNSPQLFVYKGTNNYVDDFGGTSSASPTVGGVIALMLSANPNLTWREIIYILKQTSEKIDINTKGYSGTPDDTTGYADEEGNQITLSPSDADPTIRPLRSGQWKNKNGEYIHEADGVTPAAGVTDYNPVKSDWYGYGMVNAKEAVTSSLNYNQGYIWLDLVIRDFLADDGQTGSSPTIQINSPDIWVRNAYPIGHTGTGTIDSYDFNALPYSTDGPHQPPLKNRDRYIYARIRNIGTVLPNLEATVRFYIALTNLGTQFKFPDHFTEYGTIENGTTGVKLIGEVVLAEGDLPEYDGVTIEDKIVQVKWDKDASDVDTSLETTILVEITPHDGEFLGPNGEGNLIGYNNNLSCKKVSFIDNIEITGVSIALPSVINIPSTAITVPMSTSFQVWIRDLEDFTTEGAEVRLTLHSLGGTSETITLKYNAGSWSLDMTPTNGWLSIAEPKVYPFGASDLASGAQHEIRFDGIFTIDGTHDKVTIEAEFTNGNGVVVSNTEIVDISVQYVSSTSSALEPTENNQLYFFTEYDKLNVTQPINMAYGPDDITPEEIYRLTSRHTAATGDPKAFAASDGQIMVQESGTTGLVNVIIKPSNQGIIDFLNIKYYVYRGIKKETLIDSGNPDRIAPNIQGANAFVASVWDTQQKINEAIENADPGDAINPGDITDEPSSKSLGIHFVDSSPGTGQILKVNTDSLDEMFFDASSDYKFPLIKKGEEFGLFDGANIGFEVVLYGMGHVTTFGDVRGMEKTVTATVLPPNPTQLQKLDDFAVRSEILNYMDPAVFYGIHQQSGVNVIDSSGNDELWKHVNLYDNVLVRFNNKNRVYLDIRNENGYTFNYYGQYTDGSDNDIAITTDQTSNTPTEQKYGTNGWPIQILENSAFINTGEKSEIKIAFPRGSNPSTNPVVYLPFATRSSQFPNLPRRNKKFDNVTFANPSDGYSIIHKYAVPDKDNTSVVENYPYYVKLVYVRRNEPGLTADAEVVTGEEGLDNVFPLLEITPWDSPDQISYVSGYHDRFIERPDFAFIGDIGMAVEPDRVILYAVPEEIMSSGDKQIKFYKRIIGGTSNKDSFFNVIGYNFPFFKLEKTELTIGGAFKYYLNYVDGSFSQKADIEKRNFFCVGITQTEFESLILSGNSAGLNPDYHSPMLVIKNVQVLTDDNGLAFKQFDLGIAGLDFSGNYLVAPYTVVAYSKDGIMITSSNFAENEASVDANFKCIEFNGLAEYHIEQTAIGSVIKRVSVFTDTADNDTRKWPMYSEFGSPLNYDAGEISNFGNPLGISDQIELPVGIRVVLLDCKELPVDTLGSIKYIRIVTFYNGNFREGYISEQAFKNSTNERVLSTIGITDDEIFDALINDIKLDVTMAKRIKDDPDISPENTPNSDFLTLLSNLEVELDPLGFSSIVAQYNQLNILEKPQWISLLRLGAPQLEFDFEYYYDSSQGYRINLPSTLAKYRSIVEDVIPYNQPNFAIIPINLYWTGAQNPIVEGYNEAIKSFFVDNCPAIASDLIGRSGSSSADITFSNYPDHNVELKKLRTFLEGNDLDYPLSQNDPILQTPEAQWFLMPEHSDNIDGNGTDFFDSVTDYQFISYETWRQDENPSHLTTDFRAEAIIIDNSMGFVNSNNVLSVLIHEFNVSQDSVLQLADDTHSPTSEVPLTKNNTKTVTQTAWEYVRENDFTLFNSHGFKPHGSYTDADANHLGHDNFTASKNVADFLQRNPSIGVIYAQHIINKLKEL